MCSDSEKNMSAFADQNHAPSLTCVQLELYTCNFCTFQLSFVSLNYFTFYIGNIFKNVCQAQKKAPCLCSMKPFSPEKSVFSAFYFFV